jgi:hypothetical protein
MVDLPRLTLEIKTTTLDFRIQRIEGIISAIDRPQLPVNSAIRQIFLIPPKKGTLIDQLTTAPTPMALTLTGFCNRALDTLTIKETDPGTPELPKCLPYPVFSP